ncbi:MAG TPA: radical SAM protein [Bacteroidota bacterium]|nr:radical SAM protein [Bacteroidota bacterium]
MSRVLLTHSYSLRFDPKEHRAMTPYPPLGTLYAASWLRQSGIPVSVHDVMFDQDESMFEQSLCSQHPEIVVIYDDQFNYLTKMCLSRMREAAFSMSRCAKAHGCTVVVFSSDATDHLAEYFDHMVDFVILGEAEITLTELASHILSRHDGTADTIHGLAFKSGGEIRRTPPRRIFSTLDVLPFPAWDLADLTPYRLAWKRSHGSFSLNMVTTRGCPYHCNWCAKPIYGQVYHSRSPENVVDEMLMLKQHVAPEHIWFADDIFGLKPDWVRRFADLVTTRDAVIPFKCLSRVDLLLKEDTILHLRRAGCRTVWVGAESGSQKILDAMEKGTTVAQIYEASALLHKHGISVGFFLQYGYPGETFDDIAQTLRMVRECAPDELGISVSYPLPGTRFYDSVRAEMEAKRNWVDSADLDIMFRGTYPREFYRILHAYTHKKFRIWQATAALLRSLRRPAQINGALLDRVARSLYHALTLPALGMRLARYVGTEPFTF